MACPFNRSLVGFMCRGTTPRRAISRSSELPFTLEQRDLVLEKLNSESEQGLKKYVRPVTLRRLMEYREQHGTFETFENLVSVDGVSRDVVFRFCMKMLMQSDKEAALTNAFTPALSEERLQAIGNVTSLNVDPPFLTFVKMDLDHRVIDWRRYGFMDDNGGKMKTSMEGCYKLAAAVYPMLPLADIFIMDHLSERPTGKSIYINNDKQTLQTILYTMLTFGEQEQPKVIHMKSSAVTNYFDLRMGSDRVSCQDVFKELVQRGEIKLTPSLQNHYDRQNGVGREFLGLNALQNLVFLKAHSQLKRWSSNRL